MYSLCPHPPIYSNTTSPATANPAPSPDPILCDAAFVVACAADAAVDVPEAAWDATEDETDEATEDAALDAELDALGALELAVDEAPGQEARVGTCIWAVLQMPTAKSIVPNTADVSSAF